MGGEMAQMNTNTPPPSGLRNVLIYVNLGEPFPPTANSERDVTFLRAANLAMRRKAQGVTDVFLFVHMGANRTDAIEVALKTYGFSAAAIMHFGDENQDDLTEDHDELQEAVGRVVSRWLTKNHPGAIAYPESGYELSNFWWVGVENADDDLSWPFEVSDFASELPDAHKKQAETWLQVLGHAVDLETMQASTSEGLGQQRAAVAAATLCEWLHGFEAASGNGYYHFEPDSEINSLGIADLFLGFEAARISGEDVDEFCDEYGVEMDGLGAAALIVMTADFRSELRNALSSIFGSDSSLFFALHFAIWPQFDQPMEEAMGALLNSDHPDDLGELEAPWLFVTDGWCESADQ